MSDKQKALIAIVLVSFIGGATAAVTKLGVIEIPPISFAFIRFLFSSILILPFFIKKKTAIKKNILSLSLISLLATGNVILFTYGVKLSTAMTAQVIHTAIPLTTAIILFFLFGGKLSKRKILGLLIGLAGVLLVLLLPVIGKGGEFSGDLIGNIMLSIGLVFFSSYLVFSKSALKTYSPMTLTSMFVFVSAIVLFPFFVIEMMTNSSWLGNVTVVGFSSLVYNIVLTTIAQYLLLQYANKKRGPVATSMVIYLAPLFGFLAAFILLGERLTSGILIGAILALFGVFLVTSK